MLKVQQGMLDEVRDILLTESVLCKDGPLNFNIQTASLRLYHTQSCKSKWEVQEKLKDWPWTVVPHTICLDLLV